MNATVKLIIGILITAAGIAWYAYPEGIMALGFAVDPISSLKIIIAGIVGLILIFAGLLLVWIEAEEIKESISEIKSKKRRKRK